MARRRPPSPRSRGFRWPAEWERHEATWIAWPHDETTWGHDLEGVEAAFAAFVAAIGRAETVHVLVPDAPRERRARAALERADARRAVLHRVRTADAWVRDTGPIVVVKGRGEGRRRLALDFRFNAWGGKYKTLLPDDALPSRLERIHGLETASVPMVLEGGSIDGNGRGTVLTTEQCLLNPNRNPHLVRAEIEAVLREQLGCLQVLWLGDGIAGDDTDGHVDDITRFVGRHTIVTAVEPDPSDENHAPLEDNLRRLRAMADPRGQPFEVVPLRMPREVMGTDGRRLPASYANFYVANRVVAVPVFGVPEDRAALRTLRRLFPRRTVVGVRAELLVEGMGSLHCLSHQLPA